MTTDDTADIGDFLDHAWDETSLMAELSEHFHDTKFISCSIPSGWMRLVGDLHRSLSPDGYRIVQIKEKFGELRFYATDYPENNRALIHRAEKLSAKTCQNCGDTTTARLRNHGWVATLCQACDATGERGYARELYSTPTPLPEHPRS